MDFFDLTTTIKETDKRSLNNSGTAKNKIENKPLVNYNFNIEDLIRLFFNNKYPSKIHEISKLKRRATDSLDEPSANKIPRLEHKYDHTLKLENGDSNNQNEPEDGFDSTEFGNLTYGEAYADYEPTHLKIGKSHPYPIVESKSLATIKSPRIRYKLKLPLTVINKGILSNVQLESISYACQKHKEVLNDKRRAGFLIGDGAGVGKGRTISGIIYENFLSGRRKAIWVSVSNDLKEDAIRDLHDIGKEIDVKIQVETLKKMTYRKINSEENGNFDEGVLFITYNSLISTCRKRDKESFKSRFDQIIDWFGLDYDGPIIFDECHKAKNVDKDTKTGTLVNKLQDTLTDARIVYASATGASEPKHMAYMVRLGLWGSQTPFGTFENFKHTLIELGVSAMELIAMEMKMKGMYVARQLNFKDIKFEILEAQTENSMINGHKFRDVYSKCVDLWNVLYDEFRKAFKRNKVESEITIFQSQFWSSHQRFFKYLCISAKIQECVKLVNGAVEDGKCVVIGLQSTGESRIMDELEEYSGELHDYVSSAEGILKNLVKNFYPSKINIKKYRDKKPVRKIRKTTKLSKKEKENQCNDLDFNLSDKENHCDNFANKPFNLSDSEDDVPLSEEIILISSTSENEKPSCFTKDSEYEDQSQVNALLEKIKDMKNMLPNNVLDELIHQLGGPDYVAEMTGRKGRVVEENGCVSYKSRKEAMICIDKINLKEKDRFNSGEKLIAIISDAASIGISLHSDVRFANNRQRVHVTLELPWSADKAVQQFGRTHRSNQVIPPHYIFLISDLAGERRFAATVAKRLESLGALTHGDRRGADSSDLSKFNLDNEFGVKAIKNLTNHFFESSISVVPYPSKYMPLFGNSISVFNNAAVESLKHVGINEKSKLTVSKFLNRILGIELVMQNSLFQYFIDISEYESKKAKLSNVFDHGIREVENHNNDYQLLASLNYNETNINDQIIVNEVRCINKGIPFDYVVSKYVYDSTENMFCVSSDTLTRILAFAELQDCGNYKIFTPNFPEKLISPKTLSYSYRRIEFEEAKEIWGYIFKESKNRCMHVISETNCPKRCCQEGKRVKIMNIITGSVFSALKKIRSAIPDIKLEIIRIQLDCGRKLIGAAIPSDKYLEIIDVLRETVKKSTKPIKKKKL